MLPDCMQGPSEPCAGYTAQSARIDALEAVLAERTWERDDERKRRKDAARYRWLKINARRIDFAGLCVSDGAQLDARIDAAMSKD